MVKATPLDDVIQTIGREVHQHGSYLVSEDELLLIYGGAEDDSERFACVRDIAMQHRWGFELNGRTLSVTFKELAEAD